MSGADQQVLDDLAKSLRASDPRLARWLTGLRHRTHRRRWAVGGTLLGVVLMVSGLPVTLTLPFAGGAMAVIGAVVLAGSALSIIGWRHHPDAHSDRPLITWRRRLRRADHTSDDDPSK